jgi:hypothetical protein
MAGAQALAIMLRTNILEIFKSFSFFDRDGRCSGL